MQFLIRFQWWLYNVVLPEISVYQQYSQSITRRVATEQLFTEEPPLRTINIARMAEKADHAKNDCKTDVPPPSGIQTCELFRSPSTAFDDFILIVRRPLWNNPLQYRIQATAVSTSLVSKYARYHQGTQWRFAPQSRSSVAATFRCCRRPINHY